MVVNVVQKAKLQRQKDGPLEIIKDNLATIIKFILSSRFCVSPSLAFSLGKVADTKGMINMQ